MANYDPPGFEAGDPCNRNGCPGIIEDRPVENCTCHICPPCRACIEARTFCPECGREAKEESI
jgi:hypothetical protein